MLSCVRLCDPVDYIACLPGSSVRGIFQARTLEWGGHWTRVIFHLTDWFFTNCATSRDAVSFEKHTLEGFTKFVFMINFYLCFLRWPTISVLWDFSSVMSIVSPSVAMENFPFFSFFNSVFWVPRGPKHTAVTFIAYQGTLDRHQRAGMYADDLHQGLLDSKT